MPFPERPEHAGARHAADSTREPSRRGSLPTMSLAAHAHRQSHRDEGGSFAVRDAFLDESRHISDATILKDIAIRSALKPSSLERVTS